MDPSQEEDLKKLSSRTEELLSRLNDLSNTLNSQLKNQPAAPPAPPVATNKPAKNSEPLPTVEVPQRNYFSIPINTHYLEKHEKSIKTTGSGQQFMTTSTSIFTEQHSVENVNPTPQPLAKETETFVPAHFDENFFRPAPQPEAKREIPPQAPVQQTQAHYTPQAHQHHAMPEPELPHFQQNLADPLQPAAVFSPDQAQTRRAPAPVGNSKKYDKDTRTQEIADKIAAQNKELKDRLQKYSNNLQVNAKGDILKFFAYVAPVFALLAAIGIVNALGIQADDFPKISAIFCTCLFLGIFFSIIALRLVEISELMRWAHNQILFIQSTLDEQRNK